MPARQEGTGFPLGFCKKCFRMRWIQHEDADSTEKLPTGFCTQCWREKARVEALRIVDRLAAEDDS